MRKPTIAATLCILIFSCISNKNRTAQTVPAFKKSPLDSIYTPIRPALQTFTIDNTKTTTIKAAHGTEILIPAGSLVTASGDKLTNVQLEVVEAFSLPDFVTSGLATISNGQMLISNGMAYINAKAGNEDLQLKEGASLTVSMPTMKNADGFQLFTGDGSNWTVDTTMPETDYIMPLPLDLLYPGGNEIWLYCSTHSENGIKNHYFDTSILSVTDKKYENTIIATEEFKERWYAIKNMMQNMSILNNSKFHPFFFYFDCETEKFNYDIWKVYFDHPNRPLWESDSIAKKMFRDYYKTNKDSLAAHYEESIKLYEYQGNLPNDSFLLRLKKMSVEEYFMQPLKYFPPVNSKKLKLLTDHGVNLDSSNAHEQLAAKGVNEKEITEILSFHFRWKEKIRKLRSEKEGRENISKLYETSVFSVNKLGWINCDRFFDDPTAGKAEMYVSNTMQNKLDYVDYSLVIPDLNVRLAAYKDSSGRYTFTKNNGVYTKLPLGKNAVITAVSLQKDSLYYASQKIKITDGLAINLSMKQINTKNLKDSLQAALNN
jgi:hypothetical protein